MIPEYAIIWCCYDCGNYYASSNSGDLRTKLNTDIKGDVTFPRARCPTQSCASRGTMRTPIKVPLVDSIATKKEIDTKDLPHWLGQLCGICGRPLIKTGDVIVCSGCGKIEHGSVNS